MEEFQIVLLHCGLIYLGYWGNIFTRRNGHPNEAFVQERLDRACASIGWRKIFPHAIVWYLWASYSEHDPIFLTLQGDGQSTKRKWISKRFEEK